MSTGKTTLLTSLRPELPGWNVIEESVREVVEPYGVRTAGQWSLVLSDRTKYRLVSEALLERQLRSEHSMPFITDGSIYKIYAYARVGGVELPPRALSLAAYDLIIYCPTEFRPVRDDFRFLSGRQSVDRELRQLIMDHHRGPVFEARGSPSARLAMSRQWLGLPHSAEPSVEPEDPHDTR